MLLGTLVASDDPTASQYVSIPREDSCFWEPLIMPQATTNLGFNPQRGFMLLGTAIRPPCARRSKVSIPREDSCFWEPAPAMFHQKPCRFNPQRGFMLLGTNAVPPAVRVNCVSIPREDSCFWEHTGLRAGELVQLVSIPREDSCFWELTRHLELNMDNSTKFQSPERIHAFGNLGVHHHPPVRLMFQSPERIHAFGNFHQALSGGYYNVSIPREDSCFWEPQPPQTIHHNTNQFQSPERIHAFGNLSQ